MGGYVVEGFYIEIEAINLGSGGGKAFPPQALSAVALLRLEEGITLDLSRWTALQMAAENQWAGSDSRVKPEMLASTILSWFAHTKCEHYINDMENMLYKDMRKSLNTEIGNGSVEEKMILMMLILSQIPIEPTRALKRRLQAGALTF